MEFKKLDFSQFHPLDHWPGMRRCREHYGSWRHHLSLTWQFRRKDQALWPVRRIKCLFGRHSWQVWYVTGKTGAEECRPVCGACEATREPTEKEKAGPAWK